MSFSAPIFSANYLHKAEQVFLQPQPQYAWTSIISGVSVRTQSGQYCQLATVGQNTFRGFHKINKHGSGAKESFVNYFLSARSELIRRLAAISTREEYNTLCNEICQQIRAQLSNCKSSQLRSYNKVRKPVDLYMEHLVAMASELASVRAQLTPLLFLPLDSQMFAAPDLFSNQELATHDLSRSSTYQDVSDQSTYDALQSLLIQKAKSLSLSMGRAWDVIYFDLLWNNRYRLPGRNLFETNP